MSNGVEADTHSQTNLTEADSSKDTPEEVVSGNSPNPVDDSSLDKINGALDRYTELEARGTPGVALIVISALIVLGSLYIGITAGLSGLFGGGGSGGEEGFGMCCAGFIVAGILGVAGFSQAGAHGVKLKEAFNDVSESVNYNKTENNNAKTHLKISLGLIAGGWLIAQPWASENVNESIAIIGIALFLLGLVWLMYWLVADASNSKGKNKKKILAAARSQLKRREDP